MVLIYRLSSTAAVDVCSGVCKDELLMLAAGISAGAEHACRSSSYRLTMQEVSATKSEVTGSNAGSPTT